EPRAVVTQADRRQGGHLLQGGLAVGGFVGEGAEDDVRVRGHRFLLSGVARTSLVVSRHCSPRSAGLQASVPPVCGIEIVLALECPPCTPPQLHSNFVPAWSAWA